MALRAVRVFWDEIYQFLRPGLARYAWAEREAKAALLLLGSISVPICIAVFLIITFFVAQTREVLRVVAENWTSQPSVLFWSAAGLVWASVSLWYCARVLLYQLKPRILFESNFRGRAARLVPRLLGAAVPLALGASCFWSASSVYAMSAQLRLMGAVCVGWSVLFFSITTLRGRVIDAERKRWLREKSSTVNSSLGHSPRVLFRDLPRSAQGYIFFTNAAWVVLFVLSAFTDGAFARAAGCLSILLLAGATWTPLLCGIVYLGKVARFPLLTSLVVAAILFSWLDLNDNHALRELPTPREQLPPSVAEGFETWLQSRADYHRYPEGEYPVFLVTAEGGGIRTAFNTAQLLSAITDRNSTFSSHVFAISGVSGGAVGATVFTALCAEYGENTQHRAQSIVGRHLSFGKLADQVLREDLLSPLIASALFPDLVQRFLPFTIPAFDRARSLEHGLERAWRKAVGNDRLADSFYSLRDNPQQAAPHLFLNTTLVETGERLVISSLYPSDERFARLLSFPDLRWTADIPASTAAFTSARFTLVTPVASFDLAGKGETEAKVRLADGGYFENSGAATLTEVLTALRAENRKENQRRCRLYVLVLSSPTPPLRTTDGRIEHPQHLGEVLSPIRTLLNTRTARGVHALAMLEVTAANLTENGQFTKVIRFDLVQDEVDLPLGWLLSNAARAEIVRQLGEPISGDRPFNDRVLNAYSYGEVVRALRP